MTVTSKSRDEVRRSVDWERVRAMTEGEIEANIGSDPDASPPLTEVEALALWVQGIRRRLALTQQAFAEQYHVPLGTLRDWEQARFAPDRAARAYLRVIEQEPAMVKRTLESHGID